MYKPRHWLVRRSPCDAPIILLLFMTGLSLIVSPLPRRSLGAVWPLLLGLILYWVIARWPWTETQLEWAWWGMLLLGTGLALVGFGGMSVKPRALFPWMQRWLLGVASRLESLRQRLPDTFHPNVVAAALELLVPFGVAKVLQSLQDRHRRHWVPTLLAGVLTLTMLVILVLTQSRAAYMGLAVALLVLVALSRTRWLLIALPVLTGAVIGGGMLVGWSNLADALVSRDPAYGLEWRRGIWSAGIQMAGDFPFTGVGFGCFEPVMSLFYPLVSSHAASHAHNLFLQVAIDLGLPGMVAFVAILGLVAHLGIRSYAESKRARQAPWLFLSAACLASLAGLCVHGLFDAASWGNKGAFVPWMAMGLSVALYQRSGEVTKPTGNSDPQ
jgi:putative inorganic carbon (HCO3(-)) transporter